MRSRPWRRRGAKESELKSLRKAADKDLEAIRESYEAELELLQRTWDEFRTLYPRQILEDEMLWRELRDRYEEYFEGGMGADAIKLLIDRIDLDEEEIKLREAIDPAGGSQAAVGPAQAEGHQAPQDRGRVQPPQRARATGSTSPAP